MLWNDFFFFVICENNMQHNINLVLKMGAFPWHIPNTQYILSAAAPRGGGGGVWALCQEH